MATRSHDSPPVTVHQSTGKHKFVQRRWTHAQTSSAAPGGASGHTKASFLNTVQRVKITDSSGGTFTLTVAGRTTAAIAYNAEPGVVADALSVAWPDDAVGAANFQVDGSVGDYLIEFTGEFEFQNLAAITADATNLTGSGHAATVTVVQQGNAGSVRSLVGGHDDILADRLLEAEAPALGNIASPVAPVGSLIRSGTVTVPAAPEGAEENTRSIWRGNTFGKRIPGLGQS